MHPLLWQQQWQLQQQQQAAAAVELGCSYLVWREKEQQQMLR
jgi:hypothetical protein